MSSLRNRPCFKHIVMTSVLSIALLGVTSSARAGSDEPSFNDLSRKLLAAYEDANYKQALDIAEQMHELRPKHVETIYNIACLHCLLGEKKAAYEWIEKAIDAGYSDANYMLNDKDFKTIRGEDRFRNLIKKIRQSKEKPKKSAKPKKPDKPEKAGAEEAIRVPKMSPREHGEKVGELTQKVIEASNSGERQKALQISLQALGHARALGEAAGDRANNALSLTNYNVACMYALLGKTDKSFQYLNKAVDFGGFGGNLVNQIKGDKDFDSLRKDARYAAVLKRAKKRTEAAQREDEPKQEKVEFRWKVTLPENHDKSREAPLLIALHHYNGTMERTTKRWKKAASEVGAILLTPQGTVAMGEDKYQWGRDLDAIEDNVMDAIEAVTGEYKVDEDRIVVAGFSQGGWLTWALAMRNPDAFCGIIPVAGRFEWDSSYQDDELANLRVFIMVGEEENSRVLEANKGAADRLKKMGSTVKLNIYEEVGHAFPDNHTEEQVKALKFVLAA